MGLCLAPVLHHAMLICVAGESAVAHDFSEGTIAPDSTFSSTTLRCVPLLNAWHYSRLDAPVALGMAHEDGLAQRATPPHRAQPW